MKSHAIGCGALGEHVCAHLTLGGERQLEGGPSQLQDLGCWHQAQIIMDSLAIWEIHGESWTRPVGCGVTGPHNRGNHQLSPGIWECCPGSCRVPDTPVTDNTVGGWGITSPHKGGYWGCWIKGPHLGPTLKLLRNLLQKELPLRRGGRLPSSPPTSPPCHRSARSPTVKSSRSRSLPASWARTPSWKRTSWRMMLLTSHHRAPGVQNIFFVRYRSFLTADLSNKARMSYF